MFHGPSLCDISLNLIALNVSKTCTEVRKAYLFECLALAFGAIVYDLYLYPVLVARTTSLLLLYPLLQYDRDFQK